MTIEEAEARCQENLPQNISTLGDLNLKNAECCPYTEGYYVTKNPADSS